MLYDSLVYCKDYPNTSERFNEAAWLIREGRVPLPPNRSADEYISWLEGGFRRCDGTDEKMLEEATALLKLAADTGDKRSAIRFAFSIAESNPDLAEEYFGRLWEGGSINGLTGLAEIYRERANATASHELAVKAYAYAYASMVVRLAELDGYSGEAFAQVRTYGLNALRDLEVSTSHVVAQSGSTLARDILTKQDTCCTE